MTFKNLFGTGTVNATTLFKTISRHRSFPIAYTRLYFYIATVFIIQSLLIHFLLIRFYPFFLKDFSSSIKTVHMKRIVLSIGLMAIMVVSLSSCTSTRDCQGRSHTRLSNGVTI